MCPPMLRVALTNMTLAKSHTNKQQAVRKEFRKPQYTEFVFRFYRSE